MEIKRCKVCMEMPMFLCGQGWAKFKCSCDFSGTCANWMDPVVAAELYNRNQDLISDVRALELRAELFKFDVDRRMGGRINEIKELSRKLDCEIIKAKSTYATSKSLMTVTIFLAAAIILNSIGIFLK